MSVVLLPLWMLSSSLFPAPTGILGVLMKINPLTYMVDGVRLSLSGIGLGNTAGSVRDFAMLSLLAVVTIIAAVVSANRTGGLASDD